MSTEAPPDRRFWPEHLRPGAVRFARSSPNYDQTIRFYRDILGLPVVGEFADSFGEDGTIFGLPDTQVQLEIVRARGGGTAADLLDMLVLYLSGTAAVAAATAPLRTAGVPMDPTPHPYWVARGGIVHLDPMAVAWSSRRGSTANSQNPPTRRPARGVGGPRASP